MNTALLILIAIAIVLLLCYFSGRRVRENHAFLSISEAVAALEEAVDNGAGHDRFDDFISWPINDPYMEAIRLRALQITLDAVEEPGRDLSVAATEQLQLLLSELRAHAEQDAALKAQE